MYIYVYRFSDSLYLFVRASHFLMCCFVHLICATRCDNFNCVLDAHVCPEHTLVRIHNWFNMRSVPDLLCAFLIGKCNGRSLGIPVWRKLWKCENRCVSSICSTIQTRTSTRHLMLQPHAHATTQQRKHTHSVYMVCSIIVRGKTWVRKVLPAAHVHCAYDTLSTISYTSSIRAHTFPGNFDAIELGASTIFA